MNKILIIIFALSPLLWSSCRRNKIQKTISEIKKDNDIAKAESVEIKKPEIKRSLLIEECKLSRVKIKAKVDFESPLFSQSFPANIHIKKDSVMWVSVAIGIEVGRALISKDSILVMDRINRKYYEFSMDEIGDQFGIQLNYKMLESLVLGDLPVAYQESDSLSFNSLYTSVYQSIDRLKIESQVDNSSRKLLNILANDKINGTKLGIAYEEFTEVGASKLPQSVFAKIDNIIKTNTPSTSIKLNYSKIEEGEEGLKFPFNIPKTYEKGVINNLKK